MVHVPNNVILPIAVTVVPTIVAKDNTGTVMANMSAVVVVVAMVVIAVVINIVVHDYIYIDIYYLFKKEPNRYLILYNNIRVRFIE